MPIKIIFKNMTTQEEGVAHPANNPDGDFDGDNAYETLATFFKSQELPQLQELYPEETIPENRFVETLKGHYRIWFNGGVVAADTANSANQIIEYRALIV